MIGSLVPFSLLTNAKYTYSQQVHLCNHGISLSVTEFSCTQKVLLRLVLSPSGVINGGNASAKIHKPMCHAGIAGRFLDELLQLFLKITCVMTVLSSITSLARFRADFAGIARENTANDANESNIFCCSTEITRSSCEFLSLACQLVRFPVLTLTINATISYRFAAFAVHQGACCHAARVAGISHFSRQQV
jgi:hypothetical protein